MHLSTSQTTKIALTTLTILLVTIAFELPAMSQDPEKPAQEKLPAPAIQ